MLSSITHDFFALQRISSQRRDVSELKALANAILPARHCASAVFTVVVCPSVLLSDRRSQAGSVSGYLLRYASGQTNKHLRNDL